MMDYRTRTERYEREAGEDASRRQAQESRERFLCCGELKSAGHHIACSKRPQDDDAVIPGQESLL